jgi:hypothetical protein
MQELSRNIKKHQKPIVIFWEFYHRKIMRRGVKIAKKIIGTYRKGVRIAVYHTGMGNGLRQGMDGSRNGSTRSRLYISLGTGSFLIPNPPFSL